MINRITLTYCFHKRNFVLSQLWQTFSSLTNIRTVEVNIRSVQTWHFVYFINTIFKIKKSPHDMQSFGWKDKMWYTNWAEIWRDFFTHQPALPYPITTIMLIWWRYHMLQTVHASSHSRKALFTVYTSSQMPAIDYSLWFPYLPLRENRHFWSFGSWPEMEQCSELNLQILELDRANTFLLCQLEALKGDIGFKNFFLIRNSLKLNLTFNINIFIRQYVQFAFWWWAG